MSRVVPGCMLSPARTIAAEFSSAVTASAIRITPSTRPAGIVSFLWERGGMGQNWK
jgi:hypothetical protein